MAYVNITNRVVNNGNWLGSMDSRVKLIVLIATLTSCFMMQSWLGLVLLLGLLVTVGMSCKIALKMMVTNLTPVLFFVVFTILVNGFGFGVGIVDASAPPLVPEFLGRMLAAAGGKAASEAVAGGTELPNFMVLFGGFGFRPIGFQNGCFWALRLLILFATTLLLTMTSSITSLTDALVAWMCPLAVLHVPTEDIALVFTITLRFIQVIAEEAERIFLAQQARGAAFDSRNPFRKISAMLPVVIPLFVKLFRRSDNLVMAMESRCYQGQGRTHLRNHRLGLATWLATLSLASLIFSAGVLL